jgi:hypothetical protein
VNGATHLDLALDVYYLAFAEADAGSDAARPPEGEVAQPDHREAVDLPHALSGRVNQNRPPLDSLLHPLPHPVGAVNLRVNRALHVVGGHGTVAGHASPVIRLAQQIRDAQQMDR